MNTSDFLKRAAQRTGYHRSHFIESRFPTQMSNILAIPWYGDLVSTSILSTFLLRSLKEYWSDKYLILCSYPQWQSFYPYVDEYWYLSDDLATKTLAINS